MADAILSEAAGQIISLLKEQTVYHVNLIRGAEKEVRSFADELQTLRNVLDDAENRRFKDRNVNYWLSRLEQTSYEMEDVLEEWNYAILKLKMEQTQYDDEDFTAPAKQKVLSCIPSSSCLCFKKAAVRHRIAEKILNIKAQLDGILKDMDRFHFKISQPEASNPLPESRRRTSSSVDLGEVHGRERDRDVLVGMLVDDGGNKDESSIQIVSVVGMGGLGKTTLAQLVYNHSRVEESFELRIWICVSDPFDPSAISKKILESIHKGISPNTNELDVLLTLLKESISGKRYLLVLDDVWTEDSSEWKPLKNILKCGGGGSKILVTTRSDRVATIMGSREGDICRPGLISDDDCWLHMSCIALAGKDKEKFEEIGRRIAKKCNGLPLASKTLGSLLLFRSSLEEWEDVLNSEIWELEEAEVDLFPHLLLSYNELSPALKRCFSYCAIFPKDTVISVKRVVREWMALGYLGSNTSEMELKGRQMFNVIAARSLFQDFEKSDDSEEIKSFKMHDIVHDFAQFVRRQGRVEGASVVNKTICQSCGDSSLVSNVNDFFSLSYKGKASPIILFDCLLRLRVLRLVYCGLPNIPQGIEKLIHLRLLRLSEIDKISGEDLKHIFQLYNLQTLKLENCKIDEIPKEIENLINLTHLKLSFISSLKGLPSEIGNLMELRHFDLHFNYALRELPESICGLKKLRTLKIKNNKNLTLLPEKLAHLTGLRCLGTFNGGSGRNKLGLMKNLIHLNGCLKLCIRLAGGGEFEKVVEDAGEAELRNKAQLEKLKIVFEDEMDETESRSCRWIDLISALEPHQNLQRLFIKDYLGLEFPKGWMVSPVNQLREFILVGCNRLATLPCLGMLPCLEVISIHGMEELQFVSREFLGITNNSSGVSCIAFPKLKKLTFIYLKVCKEWDDITPEEEESAAFSVMPCLKELQLVCCDSLTAIPHRLLRKASSLEIVKIIQSGGLQRYGNKDDSDAKLVSLNNPHLNLSYDPFSITSTVLSVGDLFIKKANSLF